MRRAAVRGLIWLWTGLLLFSACRPDLPTPTPSPPPSPTPVVRPSPTPMTLIPLEIWHGWTEEDGALLEAVLRDYQRLHPRVWIQIRRVSSVSLKEAFRRASLNGRPPTLLLAPAHWIPDLADEGLLLPLDGLTGRADVERLYPSTLDAVRYQGILYGYPLGFHTVALYGNRRYVQVWGISWTYLRLP